MKPFVPLVSAKLRLSPLWRENHFPCMQAAWLSSKRDDNAAVASARLEPNPRIADLRCSDQVVERDAIRLREREEQLETRAPLTRLEPRQRALRAGMIAVIGNVDLADDEVESQAAIRLRALEAKLSASPAVAGALLSLSAPDEPSLTA